MDFNPINTEVYITNDSIVNRRYEYELPNLVGKHMLFVTIRNKSSLIYVDHSDIPTVKKRYGKDFRKYVGMLKIDYRPSLFDKNPKPFKAKPGDEVATDEIPSKCIPIEIEPEVNVSEPDFEVFWEMYGIKKDMHKVREKWLSIDTSVKVTIIQSVPAYLKNLPSRMHQKSPLSYLNSW